ncbi:MAG TPA: glycoside hydrolase family 16 protein [Puia sp.]|nr:glycoside hydrolase family 16 protein [Puia sp.]
MTSGLVGAMSLVCAMTTKENNGNTGGPGATVWQASGHGPDLSRYSLLFEDDFNGAELNTSVWNYRQENTVRQGSVFLRSNVTTGNGNLRLSGNKGPEGYSCSMISTEKGFHFKYGYAECRARLSNISFGATFAFWLQSATNGSSQDPATDGDEVDIFEYNLNSGGRDFIQHNLHWNGYGPGHRTQGTREAVTGLSSGYHLFGLEWTPKEYVVYVDGVEKTRTTTAVSHREEFIILSNLVTDDGFGGDRSAGRYPEFFDIDYVKVYSPRSLSSSPVKTNKKRGSVK